MRTRCIFKEPKVPELESHVLMHFLVDHDAPGACVSVPTDKVSQLVTTLLESRSNLVELGSRKAQVILIV